jgi:hypothetical protein
MTSPFDPRVVPQNISKGGDRQGRILTSRRCRSDPHVGVAHYVRNGWPVTPESAPFSTTMLNIGVPSMGGSAALGLQQTGGYATLLTSTSIHNFRLYPVGVGVATELASGRR